MSKRKLLLVAMSLCMVAILAMGGTLAYLTDTDNETNVFTMGNVEIDLYENFDPENAELFPTTGKDEKGNIINAVDKEVYVTNTGSEDAFVRVHIAIPQILDNGRPDFDASQNVLHFNYNPESIGADKWDWSTTTGDPYEGKPWNFYETTVNMEVVDAEGNKTMKAIAYNVYVVTYGTALKKGEATVDAMHQVYLDSKVSNEDVAKIKEELGEEWKILVAAEGAQAKGFDDAYAALNEAFGVPGDDYEIEWDLTTVEVDTTKGN